MMRTKSGTPSGPSLVRLGVGTLAGAAYLFAMMLLAVPLGGAGDGFGLPFALASPFGFVGFITWPVAGGLLASGGRGRRGAAVLLLTHYCCALVFFLLLPWHSGAADFSDPYLLFFFAVFVAGQTLAWVRVFLR
jgi:hypothetical protein